MTHLATITSKRQLTIPSELFRKAGLSEGDKVLMEEKNGVLHVRSATDFVEHLAGSVSIPKNLKSLDVDKAIKMAKRAYFKNKAP